MVFVNDANDLKRQRDRFLAFSFASADLFIEIGADEHIVYTLGAARSLAGASDEGLKGRHWCDMFSQAEHTQLSAPGQFSPGRTGGETRQNVCNLIRVRRAQGLIKFAAQAGALDEQTVMMESLLAFKRAGADLILSYFAPEAVRLL